MKQSIRVNYESLRTLGFAAIQASPNYTALTTMAGAATSAEHPIRTFTIQNLTNQSIYFSIDGTNPFIIIPSGQNYTEDVATNQVLTQGAGLPRGTKMYVAHAGVAPTVGSVYWTIMYGSDV